MYSPSRKHDDSEDKEFQRKKEVDDLISKYASKKSKSKIGINQNTRDINDYSSVRLGQANVDRTYGGASNTFSSRRSSQYDSISKIVPSSNAGSNYEFQPTGNRSNVSKYDGTGSWRSSINSNNDYPMTNNTYNEKYDKYSNVVSSGYGTVGLTSTGGLSTSASSANIYAPVSSGPPPSAARRYLAQSKSSSNLYLYPQSNALSSTLHSQQDPSQQRLPLTRQQKTLSIHGLPGTTTSNASPFLQRGGVLSSGGSSSALFANLRNNQEDFYLERENVVLENNNQADWRKKQVWNKSAVSKGIAPIIPPPPPIKPVYLLIKIKVHHCGVLSVLIQVNPFLTLQ